jgi:hypothetical protein
MHMDIIHTRWFSDGAGQSSRRGRRCHGTRVLAQVSTAQGTGIVITKNGYVLIIFIHIYRCPPGDNDYGTELDASRFCKASQHLSARVLP